MDVLILVAIFLIIGVGFTYGIIKAIDNKQSAEFEAAQEEAQKRKNAIAKKESIIQKYGEATAEIAVGDDFLMFFESSKIALIQENPIPFNKILSYSLCDNQQIIATTTGEANSSTSTGSMAGRALVGGVLLGGVGALAGAATAKRDTEINTTTSYDTRHDYIIYLSLNDMANPQVIIRFGNDADSANKAASIFGIIINQSNK